MNEDEIKKIAKLSASHARSVWTEITSHVDSLHLSTSEQAVYLTSMCSYLLAFLVLTKIDPKQDEAFLRAFMTEAGKCIQGTRKDVESICSRVRNNLGSDV